MGVTVISLGVGAVGAVLAFLVFLLDFRRASARDPLTPVAPTWSARRARRVVGVYVRHDEAGAAPTENAAVNASARRWP